MEQRKPSREGEEGEEEEGELEDYRTSMPVSDSPPMYASGVHTSTYGANLTLWMCKWSIPITIPNQSQVAALVAKKK